MTSPAPLPFPEDPQLAYTPSAFYQRGRAAYANDIRIPAHDTFVYEMKFHERPHEAKIVLIRAWMTGWDDAQHADPRNR